MGGGSTTRTATDILATWWRWRSKKSSAGEDVGELIDHVDCTDEGVQGERFVVGARIFCPLV